MNFFFFGVGGGEAVYIFSLIFPIVSPSFKIYCCFHLPRMFSLCSSFSLFFCFLGSDGGLFSIVSVDFTAVSVVIFTVAVSVAVSFVDFVSEAGLLLRLQFWADVSFSW